MIIKCKYEICENVFEYKWFKKYCCKKCKSKDHKKRQIRPYIIHKKDVCELCNFVPEHECQLDVDHIDGNNKNNDPINLQTLCANCHRIKTYKNKDWKQTT